MRWVYLSTPIVWVMKPKHELARIRPLRIPTWTAKPRGFVSPVNTALFALSVMYGAGYFNPSATEKWLSFVQLFSE